MNKQRRKELAKASGLLEEALNIVQMAADEEREYADNMPESLQYSEKHDTAEETADNLESVVDDIQTAIDNLADAYE